MYDGGRRDLSFAGPRLWLLLDRGFGLGWIEIRVTWRARLEYALNFMYSTCFFLLNETGEKLFPLKKIRATLGWAVKTKEHYWDFFFSHA